MEPHYRLPFLSWFPKKISNFYLRAAGRGNEYYENLLSYRNLRKLAAGFKLYDYTADVIRHPQDYEADIRSSRIVSLILNVPLVEYALPGYLWVLEKPGSRRAGRN